MRASRSTEMNFRHFPAFSFVVRRFPCAQTISCRRGSHEVGSTMFFGAKYGAVLRRFPLVSDNIRGFLRLSVAFRLFLRKSAVFRGDVSENRLNSSAAARKSPARTRKLSPAPHH
jgi:hypothetical protein